MRGRGRFRTLNRVVANEESESEAPSEIVSESEPVVIPGSATFDSGSGNYTVVPYNILTIEVWGGGASGGGGANGTSGNASTVSTYGLSAGGGLRATAQNTAGIGGTASGGNTTNTNGGNGVAGGSGNGVGGAGGNSPNGGLGGAGAPQRVGNGSNAASPGNPPGGGGGGLTSSFSENHNRQPGGGAGAYVKHVFNAGAPGAPNPGGLIAFAVGAAVAAATAPGFNGNGAAGRVKFTVA